MQVTLRVTRQPKWLQNGTALAQDIVRHQLSNPYHLKAVIRISNDVDVLTKHVTYRETVRRKRPESAGRLVFVERVLPHKTRLTEGQRRTPRKTGQRRHRR